MTTDSADNASDGIVIEDAKGNQFVWIPVKQASDYAYQDANRDRAEAYPDGIYDVDKLAEYGGFYVSRFELGWVDDRCVSVKGIQPVITASQDAAIVELKRSFINTAYAKTGLITDAAWDTMAAFVNGKRTGTGQIYKIDDRVPDYDYGQGLTGKSEAHRVCNIYDLSGNYNEFSAGVVNTLYGDRPCFRGQNGYINGHGWSSILHFNDNRESIATRAMMFVFG